MKSKGGPTYVVAFRRRRKEKTDYNKRLAILKSMCDRFVVRISSNLVRMQIISYQKEGDKTILSATSNDLKKFGWNYGLKNTPAIYLTAYLVAEKAKKKGIKKVVFDTGARNYKTGSKIYAALKAVVDAGLECPNNPKAFPVQERIEGKHISEYLKKDINKSFLAVKEKLK